MISDRLSSTVSEISFDDFVVEGLVGVGFSLSESLSDSVEFLQQLDVLFAIAEKKAESLVPMMSYNKMIK